MMKTPLPISENVQIIEVRIMASSNDRNSNYGILLFSDFVRIRESSN